MAIYNEEIDPNTNAGLDMTNKEYLIDEIKSIIKDYGIFTTGEVNAESSPCIESKGNLTHLIEFYNEHTVNVFVYSERFGDDSIDSYLMYYEELEEDILEEILELAQTWSEINDEN